MGDLKFSEVINSRIAKIILICLLILLGGLYILGYFSFSMPSGSNHALNEQAGNGCLGPICQFSKTLKCAVSGDVEKLNSGAKLNEPSKCYDKNDTYSDYCVGNILYKYECGSDACVAQGQVDCSSLNQSCVNGMCVDSNNKNMLCTDSDGGIVPEAFGTCISNSTGIGKSVADKCISGNQVSETYCGIKSGSQDCYSQTIQCKSNEKCADGACVAQILS